jgi:rhomboid protease GluP
MSDYQIADYQPQIQPPVQQRAPSQPKSVVTLTLIGINVLVFVAMVASGLSPTNPGAEQLLAWGADYGPLTIGAGQWWRVLTACFLHFGIVHIGFNMYVLYQVGIFTEMLFGRVKYLLLYILAGLGGNFLSLWIHPMSVAAGASGAIFGVYGGLLAFLLVRRTVFRPGVVASIGKSAALFLGYNLIFGLSSGTTDLSAHIGGLVSGFLIGCVLARQPAAR